MFLFFLISAADCRPNDASVMGTIDPDNCPSNRSLIGFGSIASPGFPDRSYGANLNCTFELTCSIGQIVRLEFMHFDTETNGDYVHITDVHHTFRLK